MSESAGKNKQLGHHRFTDPHQKGLTPKDTADAEVSLHLNRGSRYQNRAGYHPDTPPEDVPGNHSGKSGAGFQNGTTRTKCWERLRATAQNGTPELQFLCGKYCEKRLVGSMWGAFHWYCLAARRGHVEAMYRLARLLERGTGVRQNPVRAMYWYRQAAAHGHVKSRKYLRKHPFPTPGPTPDKPAPDKPDGSQPDESGPDKGGSDES